MTVSRDLYAAPTLSRRLLWAGTALATGLFVSTGVVAQQVTLTTADKDVTIQGDLVSFDSGVYVVNTIIGEISISGDDVVCAGPGCPGAAGVGQASDQPVDRSVVLTNDDGGVRLEGELVEVTDDAYVVETIIGRFDIFIEGTLCEGPGCPDTPAVPVETEVVAVEPEVETPAPTPVLPAPEIVQSARIIPVARPTAEPNLRLAGPASIVAGMLPTLVDELATVTNTTAELDAPELVTEQDATAEGVGAGSLSATLSSDDGADTVVLARLQSSSDEALRSLNSGETDLAIVSAPAPLMQLQTRTETVLGNEGLVAIVSRDNIATELSPAQLAGIFSGEITNWLDVGGTNTPIRLMGMPDTHDLSVMLDQLVLTPNLVDPAAPEVIFSDLETLTETVADTPGAIAFVGQASKGEAKALGVGSSCTIATYATPENIRTARYPYSRAIMALSFSEDGAAADLLARMGENAEGIVTAAGLEPVSIDRFPLDGDMTTLRTTLSGITDRFERINISNALRIMPAADRLGTILRLENDGNRLTLRSQGELERVIDYVVANEIDEIFVVGYSHNTGSTETNRSLGRITAASVKNSIRAADATGALNGAVIRTISLGAISPLACDDALDAVAQNQRAEIWVRR